MSRSAEAVSHPAQLDQYRRLSGPSDGSFVTDTAEEASVMGVHFKPFGVSAQAPGGDSVTEEKP
jgi:hypothetical protein